MGTPEKLGTAATLQIEISRAPMSERTLAEAAPPIIATENIETLQGEESQHPALPTFTYDPETGLTQWTIDGVTKNVQFPPIQSQVLQILNAYAKEHPGEKMPTNELIGRLPNPTTIPISLQVRHINTRLANAFIKDGIDTSEIIKKSVAGRNSGYSLHATGSKIDKPPKPEPTFLPGEARVKQDGRVHSIGILPKTPKNIGEKPKKLIAKRPQELPIHDEVVRYLAKAIRNGDSPTNLPLSVLSVLGDRIPHLGEAQNVLLGAIHDASQKIQYGIPYNLSSDLETLQSREGQLYLKDLDERLKRELRRA